MHYDPSLSPTNDGSQFTEEGFVRAVRGGVVQVESVASGACSSCSARGGCHSLGGDPKRRMITALNQIGAEEGDRVLMSMPRRGALGAGFLVYMVPVLALIIGAYLGQTYGPSYGYDAQNAAVVLGLSALALVWVGLHFISKKLSGRKELSIQVVKILAKNDPEAVSGIADCITEA